MVSLLQLDIEFCEQQDKRKMTSLDWKRPALEILLKLYKEHPLLYDMRHPKYYAKVERQKVLNTIIDLLEDHRPGTTTGDILKKIQTMRTQFGQEFGKVRKAQAKGIVYTPTVWWYQQLAFLRKHVKPRLIKEELDESPEPEDEYMSVSQGTEIEYENYATEDAYEVDTEAQSEIVYEIQQSSPSDKGPKEEATIYRQRAISTSTPARKEEIIYEITNANTIVPKRKVEMISADEPSSKQQRMYNNHNDQSMSSSTGSIKRTEITEITVEPDRAKSFGQFVASQIAAVKDDFLFYSTQMEVLNVVNKAQLAQLQMDKDAASKQC